MLFDCIDGLYFFLVNVDSHASTFIEAVFLSLLKIRSLKKHNSLPADVLPNDSEAYFLSPEGSLRKQTPRGHLNIFYFIKYVPETGGIRLFENLKMFYPPKGAAIAEPKVVQLFLLMFYPPKEIHLCMSWGPFEHLNIYLPYGLRKLGFKNTLGNRPLLSPENFYHGWWWWME